MLKVIFVLIYQGCNQELFKARKVSWNKHFIYNTRKNGCAEKILDFFS